MKTMIDPARDRDAFDTIFEARNTEAAVGAAALAADRALTTAADIIRERRV